MNDQEFIVNSAPIFRPTVDYVNVLNVDSRLTHLNAASQANIQVG